jgi:hypothetical protein
MIVITARVAMRFLALSKLFRSRVEMGGATGRSWVKACTVCTLVSASDALPELSAIQSWFSRLSARRRRPSTTIGTITTGTISRTDPESFGEV